MAIVRGEISLRRSYQEVGDNKMQPVLVIFPSWRNARREGVADATFSF